MGLTSYLHCTTMIPVGLVLCSRVACTCLLSLVLVIMVELTMLVFFSATYRL